MRMTVGTTIASLSAIGLLLASCSSSSPNPAPGGDQKAGEAQKEDTKPVTVRMLGPGHYIPTELFNAFIVEPLKKKYPYITVEKIDIASVTQANIEKVIASGIEPDLLLGATPHMSIIQGMGFTENMEPLIKKHNFDLNRLQPVALQSVKTASGGEYVSAIPYFMQFNALYYNKEIFNKFGVPYPKDGMTWDDAAALARQLARQDNGVQYKGLEPDYVYRAASQLSLPLIDPINKKAAINTDKWKYVFETLKSIYTIPGNKTISPDAKGFNEFSKDKNLAMFVGLNRLDELGKINDQLDWDIVSAPSFKEAPATGTSFDGHVMIVSKTSKNKDAAFKVIETFMSDEVQMGMARIGRLSTLKDNKMKEEFGKDIPYLRNKNIQAIFKTTPAVFAPTTVFDQKAKDSLNAKMAQTVNDGKDINTALREAEEEVNKYMEQELKK